MADRVVRNEKGKKKTKKKNKETEHNIFDIFGWKITRNMPGKTCGIQISKSKYAVFPLCVQSVARERKNALDTCAKPFETEPNGTLECVGRTAKCSSYAV